MIIKNLKKNDSTKNMKLIKTIYDIRKVKNIKKIEQDLKELYKRMDKRVLFRKKIDNKKLQYYAYRFGANIRKKYLFK